MAKRLASSPATLIGRAARLRDRSRLMRTALARFTSQAASRTKSVQRVLSPCLTFLLRHNIASLIIPTTTHRVDNTIACVTS